MNFGKQTDLVAEGSTDTVRLDVEHEGKIIRCRVSREALEDIEATGGGDTEDPLHLANKHYDRLVWSWMNRIKFGPFENDGSVLLRSGDIQ